MRGTWTTVLTGGVASLVLVAAVHAGGWAIVTVRDLPEYAIAGEPLQLTFMVRQHGMSPVGGLAPDVAAKSGAETVKASAVRTKKTGEYRATLVLPRPGNWTIHVDTIEWNDATLPELTVIARGGSAPAPLSKPALGERLFVSKGCIGCHIHREVPARNLVDVGPDLTGKRFPDKYLTSLLADPQATLRRDSEPEGGDMPDLGLTKSEIAALAAFINRERPH
jgi:mono/diheme cytochrome c family protein